MNRLKAMEHYFNSCLKPRNTLKVLEGWDESISLVENARRLNLTKGNASAFANRYGLKWKTRPYATGCKSASIVELRKRMMRQILGDSKYANGWTMASFGKVFGITRERVRQLRKEL